MNRSLRAQESQMQAALKQQLGVLRSSLMKEKDDELTLFRDMRNRDNDLLLRTSHDFDAPLGILVIDWTVFFFGNWSEEVLNACCVFGLLFLSLQVRIREVLPYLTTFHHPPPQLLCVRMVLMIFSIQKMIRMTMTGMWFYGLKIVECSS